MQVIKEYQELAGVKPAYHELQVPFFRDSQKRFLFNTKRLELWWNEEFGVYQEEEKKTAPKKGGAGGGKVLCFFWEG